MIDQDEVIMITRHELNHRLRGAYTDGLIAGMVSAFSAMESSSREAGMNPTIAESFHRAADHARSAEFRDRLR